MIREWEAHGLACIMLELSALLGEWKSAVVVMKHSWREHPASSVGLTPAL